MFYRMAAANASARGQRAAIVASPLHDLTGFYLAVDCLAPGCGGERSYAVADWRASAAAIARSATWCAGCAVPAAGGGRVGAAWLETGPILNARVRARRVPLRGPEAQH
jgi:hypothetical protein